MTQAHDLLQCRLCGEYYLPEFTVTGRTLPHCHLTVSRNTTYDGEVKIDFTAIEQRMVERYRLTDVDGPPLTELFQKGRRNMTRGILIFGAIAIILMILFGNVGGASGACILSHCQEGSSTRSYVRNNWESGRQIVGDLYRPSGGGRTQIRTNQRVITGYIEIDGSITNIYRQKKGQINE